MLKEKEDNFQTYLEELSNGEIAMLLNSEHSATILEYAGRSEVIAGKLADVLNNEYAALPDAEKRELDAAAARVVARLQETLKESMKSEVIDEPPVAQVVEDVSSAGWFTGFLAMFSPQGLRFAGVAAALLVLTLGTLLFFNRDRATVVQVPAPDETTGTGVGTDVAVTTPDQETGDDANSNIGKEKVIDVTRLRLDPDAADLMDLGITRDGSTSQGNNRLAPDGTLVNPARSIVFSWTPIKNADGYILKIATSDDRIVYEKTVNDSSHRVQSAFFTMGESYIWEVRPLGVDAGDSSTGSFGTLSKKLRDRVEAAERSYGSDDLNLGIVYLECGLFEEAQRVFSAPRNQSSAKAKELLRRLRDLRNPSR